LVDSCLVEKISLEKRKGSEITFSISLEDIGRRFQSPTNRANDKTATFPPHFLDFWFVEETTKEIEGARSSCFGGQICGN
jgi:hypothetical protein